VDDEVCLSYAPTARALEHARKKAAAPRPTRLFLARNSTLNADEEVTAALHAFPDAQVRVDCDRATALDLIERCDVAHFACHGNADAQVPLNGGIALGSGDRLTLRDMLGRQLPTRLIVLSGCETAKADTDLPEEMVNLPTLLMQAGAAA